MMSLLRQRISFKYITAMTVTIIFVFSLLFYWISHQQRQFILEQVKKQAVILHKQIVLTRQWVSDHNYVLVAKKDQADSQGYLLETVEMSDTQGKAYTRMTPAAMTRELSGYAARNRLYSFNLTNIDTKNPENVPDNFERNAISLFRSGEKEGVYLVEKENGAYTFRYAAPLKVRESCLACHDDGSFRVGGIGGCISVLIPFDEEYHTIQTNNFYLFAAMVGLTGSVILILFFFTKRIILDPVGEIRRITEKIGTDTFDGDCGSEGDEFKKFATLCYRLDQKLKDQHTELEREIQNATHDLTRTNRQLAELNEELSALNHTKSAFFSDISHEMRTPLTAIKGAVDFLSRKASCSDPAYIGIIRKNAEYLIRTFEDFLDFSKIEAGRLELEKTATSLVRIAEDVMAAQGAMAAEKQVTLTMDVVGDPVLWCDEYRIYQVLSNLVANAVKFSPAGESVLIAISGKDGVVVTAVSDRGPGIPEKYHDTIFMKFHQVAESGIEKKLTRGSAGIGLAICKGLVEAHGGTIRVNNRVGGGSRFIFKLPATLPQQT